MTISLDKLVHRLKFGEPQVSGRLTVYPLFVSAFESNVNDFAGADEAAEQLGVSYLLLEEALDSGKFQVGEVSEAGDVNIIVVTNMSGEPVLILDGEELVGAKQNRMVNATIMVAAGKTQIPVSCVERGRWRYDDRVFNKSEAFGYSSLRRQKAEQVSYNLEMRASFDADQGAIWDEVDSISSNLDTESPTAALHETYSRLEDELLNLVEGFSKLPGQAGVAVYINNRFACLDLFDKGGTLTKLWGRLLKSYAIEALNSKSSALKSPRPEPGELKEALLGSECSSYPSVSMGEDFRLTGKGIIGAGLAIEGELVHLSVFPAGQTERQNRDDGMGTPQRRRQNLGFDSDEVIF